MQAVTARGADRNEVVTMQPLMSQNPMPQGGPQWMLQPGSIAGCPPGLEYLTAVDHVLCHQIIEILQVMTGWETNNKYVVKNPMGQQIFYVFEESGYCQRWCCGANRAFVLHVVDNYSQEVMRIVRPYKLCAGCCWCAGCLRCCAYEVIVEAPPGTVIGRVKQACSTLTDNFDIQDADGDTLLTIDGPMCVNCSCRCTDVKFPVYAKDGAEIGVIAKQFSGFVREAFTQADNFGIKFPMDLNVKIKATLLAATFLIDFMAFEKARRKNAQTTRLGLHTENA